MTFQEWAERWAIPAQALAELVALSTDGATDWAGMSESAVQSRVRKEAAYKGIYLWRNNVGAGQVQLEEETVSRFMRWGLANDSKQLNTVLKSGDLIGGQPIHITRAMVGQTVLRFMSRECKEGDWKWSGTKREVAQLKWATLINSLGGDAKIVNGPGSFD